MALYWVIPFCFITIGFRWGRLRLYLSHLWKKRQTAFTNSHSHTKDFQGRRTHCTRQGRKTSLCFLFSVGRAVAVKPGPDCLTGTGLPWNLSQSMQVLSSCLFEAQCVGAIWCLLCFTASLCHAQFIGCFLRCKGCRGHRQLLPC